MTNKNQSFTNLTNSNYSNQPPKNNTYKSNQPPKENTYKSKQPSKPKTIDFSKSQRSHYSLANNKSILLINRIYHRLVYTDQRKEGVVLNDAQKSIRYKEANKNTKE